MPGWTSSANGISIIDLTEEEQAAIYARLDEQCKRYLDKSCEELLAEAGKELEEESS